MTKICIIICSLFFALTLSKAFSQEVNYNNIFKQILYLDFSNAEKNIENSKLTDSQKRYLQNYSLFLKTFLNQEQYNFNEFISVSIDNLKYFNNLNDSLPEKLFFLSEIKLQIAINDFLFGYPYKSVTNFLGSYYLIKKNNEKFPLYYKNKKILGIFEIILGNIPENLNLVKKLFLLNGDIKLGLRDLSEYNDNVSLESEKIESKIMMYYANKNFNPDHNLNFYDNSTNPLLIYTYANYLHTVDSTKKAIKVLNKYKPTSDFIFYYVYYNKGLLKLYNLDAKADSDLNYFVANFKGNIYIKSAYEKLYWWCLIFNDNDICNVKDKIKNLGSQIVDEDKQAIANIDNHNNIILLKSRLLFDGGFYNRALDLLLKNNKSEFYTTLVQKLEYLYRLARIYNKINDTQKAITLYKKVILYGENIESYMPANSSLCLAELYEKQKNFTEAKFFFEKCLSLNKYGYKNGIELKAKSGLNRIMH